VLARAPIFCWELSDRRRTVGDRIVGFC
jgi:hypothetical protein